MADFVTLCGALVTLFGFALLFWFIRRLGFLEIDAALMGDDFQRPKMQPQPMVEVKNPFKMTVPFSNNILGCIELIVSCTQSCYISCYWKVKKECLNHKVLESQSDNNGERDESLEENNFCSVHEMLQNNYEIMFSSECTEACNEKKLVYKIDDIAKKSGQADFTSKQTLFDLVVTMELTQENRDESESPCGIVAMLVGIDLRRQEQNFKPQFVQQYIQSLNGKVFKLKKLFLEETTNTKSGQSSLEETEEQPEQGVCVVCQMLPISRALIPCGHACLCVLCFDKMNTCPMCRHAITSSFILRDEPNVNDNDDHQFSEILKRMNPVEIIRGIYNAS